MALDRLMLFSNKFASDIEKWQKSRNKFREYSIFHSFMLSLLQQYILIDFLDQPFLSSFLYSSFTPMCLNSLSAISEATQRVASAVDQHLISRCHCDMPRKQPSCQNILFTWTFRKQISAIFDGVIEPPPRSKCVVTPLFGCGVVFLSTVPRENMNTFKSTDIEVFHDRRYSSSVWQHNRPWPSVFAYVHPC